MSSKRDEYEEFLENNEKLLNRFEKSMKEAGLSQRTIKQHVSVMDIFLNDFLPGEGNLDVKSGLIWADTYLTYWGIMRVFSSPSNITSHATSIKKFYHFLMDEGEISAQDYRELEAMINMALPKAKAAYRDFLNDEFDPYGEKDLF